MRTALIGHTGLVGSNLKAQFAFSELYRRQNIEEIRGQSFDLVVCAGAPAVKWLANREPAADWTNLQTLMQCLGEVETRQFVLISTVDVLPKPTTVDEYSPIDESKQQPYGRHRFLLERFVVDRFTDSCVVRLPGLFGPGLKKNVIFDLLHQTNLHAIDSRAAYQFYNLKFLWRDISRIIAANLPLVHLATEPISVRDLAQTAFDCRFLQVQEGPAASYDFRSRHALRFGGGDGYWYRRDDVLRDIRRFVDDTRSNHAVSSIKSGVAA